MYPNTIVRGMRANYGFPSTPQTDPLGIYAPAPTWEDVVKIGQETGSIQPSGNVLGANTTNPPPDPYAKYGGQDAYNQLVARFNTDLTNIRADANQAANIAGKQLNLNILDFVDYLRSNQKKINQSAVDNFARQKVGSNQVRDMVGQGIKSGGVLLANRNAGNSSAAEAIARAYGTIGRREQGRVNNQFEAGNRAIQQAQVDLQNQQAAGVRRLRGENEIAIENIVRDARDALAALEAAQIEADMPTRIEIEAEKQKIRQSVVNSLSKYDQFVSEEAGKVKPSDVAARQQQAFQQVNAGAVPNDLFNFTTRVPVEMQNGPVASPLPIFTFPRNKKER